MAGYAVEIDTLHSARLQFDSLAEDARAGLRGLAVQATELCWRGAAGSQFGANWAQWHDGAERLLEALHVLAELVGESGSGYQATETAVSTRVRAQVTS